MGNGMNKILPGLFLGNFRDAKDPTQLDANSITHIISIHDNAKKVLEDREYLCIRVPDSPVQNLTQYFPQCNDFIHNARVHGGNVLIHCLAGVSRSATIAAAYIMSVTALNSQDALNVVRGARNVANPNCGFQKQLRDYESYVLKEERKRLKRKYQESLQCDDEAECQKLLVTYHTCVKPLEVRGRIATLQRSLPPSPQRSPQRSPQPSPRHRPPHPERRPSPRRS